MIKNIMRDLVSELESPQTTKLGTGWLSGSLALVLSLLSIGTVLSFRYPDLLTSPEIRQTLDVDLIRYLLHGTLIGGFIFSIVSLILRQKKILGFFSVSLILLAIVLGGSQAQSVNEINSGVHLSLDWFMLNLLFTGFLFLPLERLFNRIPQATLRDEWREDLFYFFISSLLVQFLTYLSLSPSMAIVSQINEMQFRQIVASQPLWLQLIEIMFLTDLVQYWVHRLFHQVPFLWRFHAVHHSARKMDWLAGSRMHFVEIICLRALTVIPMFSLGYQELAIQIYLVIVYVYATYIHANVRFDIEWLKPLIVTPRFHHWHHGVEKEAIDVNFSIHFPLFDRLFGTYYMPKGKWPSGYGIAGHPVPVGFIKQFLYPFNKSK